MLNEVTPSEAAPGDFTMNDFVLMLPRQTGHYI